MRKIVALTMAALICMFATGCAGSAQQTEGSGTSPESQETTAPAADAIKIEDIGWSIGQGVYSGTRAVTFDYTNNSPYTIFGMQLDLVVRGDATEEQLSVFDEAYSENEYWEDWYGGPADATLCASTERLANPGESVSSVPCELNGSWTDATIEQYEIMEPSIMTIGYLHDGKVYIEYYDFLSQRYSLDNRSGAQAVNWSDTELASTIPQVEAPVVMLSSDEDDHFFARAWGVTRETYDSYVEACQNAGFTRDASRGGERFFYGFDSDGREIEISFYDVSETMTVSLDAAEE